MSNASYHSISPIPFDEKNFQFFVQEAGLLVVQSVNHLALKTVLLESTLLVTPSPHLDQPEAAGSLLAAYSLKLNTECAKILYDIHVH